MVTKKESIRAAETLKEWCEQTPCEQCPYESGPCCSLRVRIPNLWDVPKLRRYSDADVAMAKALKMYGYTGVRRQTDGALVVEKGDLLWYYLPPKFAFDGLRPGDSGSLDDIIGEGEHV